MDKNSTAEHLNASIAFSHLNAVVKSTFSNSNAEKVLLPKGTKLVKYSSYEIVKSSNSDLTPYWSKIGDLIKLLQKFQNDFAPEFAKEVRNKFGVLREWNQMVFLKMIILKAPVWAFVGKVAPMNEAQNNSDNTLNTYKLKHFTKSVVFSGGGTQYFIPNLKQNMVVEVEMNPETNIYENPKKVLSYLIGN